jgi:biotin-(acetyl-CoA carboxylase) ligase
LSDEIRNNATSLYAETGTLFDRESLIAELITEFERKYFNLERTNYEHVITDWKNRCHHLEKNIIIESHAGSEQGKFLDITEKGILVKIEGQTEGKEIVAGTIKSLKVVDGSDG